MVVRWLLGDRKTSLKYGKPDDDLVRMSCVFLVDVDSVQVSEPHSYPVKTDEVWGLVKGNWLYMVGKEVRVQMPGDAVACYPAGVPHSIINVGGETNRYFYFAYYNFPEEEK